MALRWLAATLHLLALAIGFGAVFVRARALQGEVTPVELRRAFAADNCWGVAGALWLGSGFWRAFGGLEKGTQYYLQNPLFQTKLALVGLLLLLELVPMVALIRWRIQLRRGKTLDLSPANSFAFISYVQVGLLLMLLLLATAISRGIGT